MIEYTPGDIILVGSNSFLSKGIQFFMKAYNKKLGLPEKKEYYSHAALVINVWGQLYVAEALADGINVAPLDKTYANTLKHIKVLTPKKAYSNTEKEDISKIASAYALTPTRYDFLNFLYQIDMIKETTKKDGPDAEWDGPTGSKAEHRIYCSELVATCANKVRPDTFKLPAATNPLDIELNRYYKVKYPVEVNAKV
jgi:hypothetical protein